jgi:putative pyruvate formate lyase activating enzyme
MRVAWAGLHFGEEPPLTGKGGSGTIFFSGCALRCAFCQNHQISQRGMGREISVGEFAEIAVRLQAMGAVNLNLVTPGQFIPSIIEGVLLARDKGCSLPLLWNTSGYETLEGLDALSGSVDVWLPDIKTLDPGIAERYFGSADYPEAAKAAALRMAESSPMVMEGGLLKRGVIVRHLVLPGMLDMSEPLFRWFAENLGGRALISVMSQYTPIDAMAEEGRGAPSRQLNAGEQERLVSMLEDYGLEGGFYQELVPGTEWLPDFSRPAPFSSELSRPLWHWASGFLA